MLEIDEIRARLVSANNENSLREIAQWCKVSYATLHNLIRGKNEPTYTNLRKISAGLEKNGYPTKK